MIKEYKPIDIHSFGKDNASMVLTGILNERADNKLKRIAGIILGDAHSQFNILLSKVNGPISQRHQISRMALYIKNYWLNEISSRGLPIIVETHLKCALTTAYKESLRKLNLSNKFLRSKKALKQNALN